MSPAAARIFFAMVPAVELFAQATDSRPSAQRLVSLAWPFGPPHSSVHFEGLLVRSDGETFSIELRDERVIRFRLDSGTQYKPSGTLESLAGFHMADVVAVESEVDSKGYLTAHSVRFVRSAMASEKAKILQCPELWQRWRANVIGTILNDPALDTRKLSLVAKPGGMEIDNVPFLGDAPEQTQPSDDALIGLVRRKANKALDRLPNFRAKQTTSLFHSNWTPLTWVLYDVVSAEIAYEEGRESYSDIRINSNGSAATPAPADLDQYMRTSGKAWSTGDFSDTLHCVFAGSKDSDFHKIRAEHGDQGDVMVYEFTGLPAMSCVGVIVNSQIVYPAYHGLLKVSAETQEVLHVELEAKDIPFAFPIDRAERSIDFDIVRIGEEQYLLPVTAYWFGCYQESYSCFLNRIDFRGYRRFETKSIIRFENDCHGEPQRFEDQPTARCDCPVKRPITQSKNQSNEGLMGR